MSIIGRFQTRQWEDESKIRHWKTEIVANSVEMLSGKRKKDYAAELATEATDTACFEPFVAAIPLYSIAAICRPSQREVALMIRPRTATAGLAALVLVLSLGAAPTTARSFNEWHRDNYGAGHERLTCNEGATAWTCFYENDVVATTTGGFSGRNVTSSWSCPDWFSSEVCDNVVAVYQGANTYIPPVGEARPFRIAQDYVVTNVDGQDILYLYWHDSFYCPWFRTFQEALDAPFECTFL